MASSDQTTDTSTLKTKLEEDFVSPLTAMRGALEILRDFPDLEPERRQSFVERALAECARLERGIEDLADAVYSAARQAAEPASVAADSAVARRVRFLDDLEVAELDLGGLVFTDSGMVNGFFDDVERIVTATGRRWYFLTNFTDCRVWPEAWVAFAYRSKLISENLALAAVRYAEPETTRDGALAEIARLREGR